MEKLRQERGSALQVTRYTLANGKQVSILATDKRVRCYQRWPNSPWEPIDPEILRFTPPVGIVAEVKRFFLWGLDVLPPRLT